jgi:hypothetical protein
MVLVADSLNKDSGIRLRGKITCAIKQRIVFTMVPQDAVNTGT